MRILHLIPTLTGGGAERQLSYLAGELARRGHDVHIAYWHQGIGTLASDGVETTRLETRYAWDPRLLFRILRLIRAWRADVVQTWIVQMDVVGGVASLVTRTPWVLREPTNGTLYAKGFKPKLRLFIARLGAPTIVANSIGGIHYWNEHSPKLARRLIANAVPVDEIDAAIPVAHDRPIVMYAGRLERFKNVDVVIAAAAEVMRELELDVVICGDGPDRARLASIAEELGIASRVRFEGYTTAVWSWTRAADVFLSLSDFEGSPNTVLEAFASNAAAILSDIEAHRVCAANECAVLVPLRDVSATAAAIRDALVDREGARQRASAARKHVEAMSIAAMTDAYEALYRERTAR